MEKFRLFFNEGTFNYYLPFTAFFPSLQMRSHLEEVRVNMESRLQPLRVAREEPSHLWGVISSSLSAPHQQAPSGFGHKSVPPCGQQAPTNGSYKTHRRRAQRDNLRDRLIEQATPKGPRGVGFGPVVGLLPYHQPERTNNWRSSTPHPVGGQTKDRSRSQSRCFQQMQAAADRGRTLLPY